MHPIDWIILFTTLIGITLFGMYRTRGIQDMKSYLVGNKDLKWWTIGLSIMATQASAITFLSTTGQGYEDGMRFVQFYFGLPIAMVILSIFFLPIFYRLNVYTAYEYLEQRFDYRIRFFTAFLFLLSRGMAAGLTIYAPAIVLTAILGWNLSFTLLMLGIFVIVYTVFGGSEAVSVTQQQQMIIILSGMVVAGVVMVYRLPPQVSFGDALHVAGKMGKMNAINFKFDLNDRYNFWSGMLGGTFLFLSYFGTDQSQVQRYLSGKSLTESRLGLLFNGLIKVPMQSLVLFVGIMMFVFYQFTQSPIHFNRENLATVQASEFRPRLDTLQTKYNQVFEDKKTAMSGMIAAMHQNDTASVSAKKTEIQGYQAKEKTLRNDVRALVKQANPKAETNDRDYVFITFVIAHLPVGIVGLLLAVIFSAAMSSKSSELNALATSSVIDFYRRLFRPHETDAHYMNVSKIMTAAWGVVALTFALFAQLFENLIEAVNIVGSLFYGTILGIFVVAFFFKRIGSNAVFVAALIAEALVITIFTLDKMGKVHFAYLWLNFAGCFLVVLFALLFQGLDKKVKSEV
jgi:solute:Na+ symporter, SSS family